MSWQLAEQLRAATLSTHNYRLTPSLRRKNVSWTPLLLLVAFVIGLVVGRCS